MCLCSNRAKKEVNGKQQIVRQNTIPNVYNCLADSVLYEEIDVTDSLSPQLSVDGMSANKHSGDQKFDNQDVMNDIKNAGNLRNGGNCYGNIQQANKEKANDGVSRKVGKGKSNISDETEMVKNDIYELGKQGNNNTDGDYDDKEDETDIVENDLYHTKESIATL